MDFRVIKYIKHPRLILSQIMDRTFLNTIFSDETYLKIQCWCYLGYKIDLKNPRTFNEKMQWLKLYGHRPEYVTMADKYAVKEYVKSLIGEDYIVPCYGVWDDANDIDFGQLPNQFVLKCTHNSGKGMCICKDKSLLNISQVKKQLNHYLKVDYSYIGKDKQYQGIHPRIIADMFLDDGRKGELQDYKWWCVNGEPKLMYITNKGTFVEENFYDMNFNPVEVNHSCPRRIPEYEKPAEFEEMRQLAVTLSKGIPFVRVDFFDIKGKIYFGEYTFFDWGGFNPFDSYATDLKMGALIEIPNMNTK